MYSLKKLFVRQEDSDERDQTEKEIISMVTEGQEQGVLQESEAELIHNVFAFTDKQAQEIMTHRNEIVALEADMVLDEAVAFMLEGNNSRFPVYEENIDHILGILHFRDAVKAQLTGHEGASSLKNVQGLIRQAHFVPETRKIDALFRSMQSSQTQIVVVIDEYGQTAGLVTMEDILEELVGEILDEYDEDEAWIEETANEDEFIIDGKTPLDELSDRFGITFDNDECETINGYMISKLDRIPAEDTEFNTDAGGYNFKILSVSNHMIQSVLVTKLKEKT